MKILLILLIFLISCTDNSSQSLKPPAEILEKTKILSHEDITRLVKMSNNQSSVEEGVQHPIEEVVEKLYAQTGTSSFFDYIPKEISTEPNPAYTNSSDLFWLEGFSNNKGKISVYDWDIYYQPISNRYYFARIAPANSVKMNLTASDELMYDELIYIEYTNWTNRLRYIGSIDLSNRVYIDAQSNQYIKKLTLIPDTVYVMDGEMVTEYPLETPVYPYVRRYEGGGDTLVIRYNNKKFDFWRLGRISDSGKLVQTCGG